MAGSPQETWLTPLQTFLCVKTYIYLQCVIQRCRQPWGRLGSDSLAPIGCSYTALTRISEEISQGSLTLGLAFKDSHPGLYISTTPCWPCVVFLEPS